MKENVIVNISGNRWPYKDDNINFQGNEEFYTIVEYDNDGKKDFSVFTEKEWKNFNEILKEFSMRRRWLASDSDYSYEHTPIEYKNAVYFLTYCDINFDNIEVKEHLEGNDVYDILQNIKNDDCFTINQTRNWIHKNYDTIHTHYQYIQNH